MRVALVHYWLVGMGGGEKVLEALCRIYPQADIFTHVVRRDRISPLLASRDIKTTLISRLPLAASHYQYYLPLMPLALEQLDLSGYDLVISSESGPAKGVITRADCLHLCYCHSPMRYLWDYWPQYLQGASLPKKLGMRIFLPYLRRADVLSSFRVDRFLANSRTVARRIAKHWRRDAAIVHPPVNVEAFSTQSTVRRGGYYICLGRLTAYKRIDLAVEACSRMGRPLLVVGEGEEMDRLRQKAAACVRFAGRLDSAHGIQALSGARALLFPGEEDFGIVPVEAMAAGVPVIAYGRGGATETVQEGKSGLFFYSQDADSLCQAIESFEAMEGDFDPAAARARAAEFSEEKFVSSFRAQVEAALRESRQ